MNERPGENPKIHFYKMCYHAIFSEAARELFQTVLYIVRELETKFGFEV
jgi:hypothetical protein